MIVRDAAKTRFAGARTMVYSFKETEAGVVELPKTLRNSRNLCKNKTFIQEFPSLRRIVGCDRIYMQDYMSGEFCFCISKRYPNVFQNDPNDANVLK